MRHLEWDIKRVGIKVGLIPRSVYFVDSEVGWLGTDNGLFRTTNAGKSWQKVWMILSPKERIRRISFISKSVGVVAIEEEPPKSELDRKIRLLTTSNAGQTWDSYTVKRGEFSFLTNDGNSFFVLGLKYEHLEPLCFNPLLLVSNADSKGWKEDDLLPKTILNSLSNKGDCSNEAAMGLSMTTDHRMRVLTSDRAIYETSVEKKSWQQWSKYEIHDLQEGLTAFGNTDNDRIWFLETTNGEEGTRGRLVVDLGEGESKVKESVQTGMVLADAAYISNDQFIVCGARVDSRKSGRSILGMILQTEDNGDTFHEIFRGRKGEQFTSINLKALQSKTYWILGDKGTVLEMKAVTSSEGPK